MATAVYDPTHPGVVEIKGDGAESRIVALSSEPREDGTPAPRPPEPCSLVGTGWHLYPDAEWSSDRPGIWEAAVFQFAD